MPIKSNIKSSKFIPQIRGYNLAEYTTKLKAAIAEKIKCVVEFEFYWYAEPKTFQIFDNGARIVRTDGVKFSSDGFEIGDRAKIQFGYGVSGKNANFDVIQISEDGFTLFTNLNDAGLNGSWGQDVECLITGIHVPNFLDVNFGLIENSESFNTFNKLTGENQGFYFDNVDSLGVQGKRKGTSKSWDYFYNSLPFIYIEFPSNIPVFRSGDFGGVGGVVVEETVINYRIEQIITINPFYSVSEFTNLLNGIAPDFLKGTNSLKYVFDCTFKRNKSNQDGNKYVKLSSQLGSVGFFGENFNGLESIYQVDSITYTVQSTSLVVDKLVNNEVMNVSILVSRNDGTFTGTEKVICSHAYLPQDEDVYLNTENFASENLKFYSSSQTDSEGFVSLVTSTLINPTTLQLYFDVNLVGQSFEEDDNYFLSVLLDDPSKTAENSDRTHLIADINTYSIESDIPGLLDFVDTVVFEHGADENDIDTSKTDFKGWIQDGFLYNTNLEVDKDSILQNISIDLVAWKDGTNDYFTIQKNIFDLSTSVIVGGIQQININELQGFKLDELNPFNRKKLNYLSSDLLLNYYKLEIGIKIDWQDWELLQGVDTIFYDNTKANNGFNRNVSNYSLKEGYTLFIIANVDVLKDSKTTKYIHKLEVQSNDFGVIGDEDWSMLPIATFDTDLNDLQGAILFGKETIIQAEFVPNFAITPNLDDYYGVIRIEKNLQLGQKQIYELSSIRSAPAVNLLEPIEGETTLKLSLNGPNIVMECRTDVDLIENVSYNVYARLGKKAGAIVGEFSDDFSNDFFN